MAQTKYIIQWRDQFGKYHNYQTQYGRTSAYRTAEQRARNTDKVYRIVDGDGNLVDLFYPEGAPTAAVGDPCNGDGSRGGLQQGWVRSL